MAVHDHPDWDSRDWEYGSFSKEHPDWKQAYQELKEVLKLREHIKK